jgi:hypothetical protein
MAPTTQDGDGGQIVCRLARSPCPRSLAPASIIWRAGLLAAEPEEVLAGPERQRLSCQAVRTDRHERIVRDTKGLLGKTGGVEPIAHPEVTSGSSRCRVQITAAPGAHRLGKAATVRWMSSSETFPKTLSVARPQHSRSTAVAAFVRAATKVAAITQPEPGTPQTAATRVAGAARTPEPCNGGRSWLMR